MHVKLRGRSQYEKAAYRAIPTMGCFGKSRSVEAVERSVVTRDWERGRGEQTEHRISRGVKLL